MKKTASKSAAIPETELLQKVLDDFSVSAGLGVAAVNLYGEVFLSSLQYELNSFCQYIRSTDEGKKHTRACKETFKWDEPYFFRCHAGLVMWAAPLQIDQMRIGAIICGQVLLWKADHLFLSEIKDLHHYIEHPETLFSKAQALKVITPDQCQAAAEMLKVVAEHLNNTGYYILIDQKNRLNWRSTVLSQIREHKKEHENKIFDRSVYLKRERSFLQYVRMENKEKIVEMFPLLYTDMEILSGYDLNEIRQMVRDFMILVSRACWEAGLEADLSHQMLRQYEISSRRLTNSEEIYAASYRTICNYLDMIFMSGIESHTGLINNIQEYIRQHSDENIGLDDIAKYAGLSKSYLCTLFRDNMNMTVNEYILRVRIENSIEIMKDRSLTIGEIGKKCGFSSQSHFTKTFKKIIGLPPGQYRNKLLT